MGTHVVADAAYMWGPGERCRIAQESQSQPRVVVERNRHHSEDVRNARECSPATTA